MGGDSGSTPGPEDLVLDVVSPWQAQSPSVPATDSFLSHQVPITAGPPSAPPASTPPPCAHPEELREASAPDNPHPCCLTQTPSCTFNPWAASKELVMASKVEGKSSSLILQEIQDELRMFQEVQS